MTVAICQFVNFASLEKGLMRSYNIRAPIELAIRCTSSKLHLCWLIQSTSEDEQVRLQVKESHIQPRSYKGEWTDYAQVAEGKRLLILFDKIDNCNAFFDSGDGAILTHSFFG